MTREITRSSRSLASKRLRRRHDCPVEFSLELLSGKWKPIILSRLREGPLRYGELRRAIPSITDKILTQRLHTLVSLGLVSRAPDPGDARRRVYCLTDRAESLRPILDALREWGWRTGGELEISFPSATPDTDCRPSPLGSVWTRRSGVREYGP